MRRRERELIWLAVGLITVGAGVLRLIGIGEVPPDPFYDAAVRSMTLSWHNFFFGAFEPGASVSIDKPPVDLWLQVISVKLLGFSQTTLKLPEAFAGTLAVPLLYSAVRRMFSPLAGVAAAAALAVLPVEVITSRSDTMDGVMMLLLVIALLLIVKAIERGSIRWLLAGAVALGVAFDVKLLESLVAVPGLALMAYLGLGGNRRARIGKVALAGVVYVVVALAWLTATLIAPASDRPWAIGSTDGSAWNAAFVFNGTDRIGGKSPEPGSTVYEPGHRYPVTTQSDRDHIPILPPSPTRLLARYGPLSGQRLGLEIVIALLLGLPAFAWSLKKAGRRSDEPQPEKQELTVKAPGAAPPAPTDDPQPATQSQPAAGSHLPGPSPRMRRASAWGLSLWMLTGLVLFSHMARLHPRYVEGFTAVVAAMAGIGLAWCVEAPRERIRAALLALAMILTVIYVERLLYGTSGVWWLTLAAALVAIGLLGLSQLKGSTTPLTVGTLACALVAVLALGVKADATAIKDKVSDAGFVGALPGDEQHALSTYLLAHRDGARYEVAAESATQIGSLIVQDAQPVVVLTTYNARVYTTVAKLKHLVAEGLVRYAFLNSYCSPPKAVNAACAEPAEWIRAHGTDVSEAAGLPRHRTLYLLPGAKP
jgi:4-amino-4-deoxy-L-arabinose transferase-like glycosyltransferase